MKFTILTLHKVKRNLPLNEHEYQDSNSVKGYKRKTYSDIILEVMFKNIIKFKNGP